MSKIEKLELRHLAGYLPYWLKAKYGDEIITINGFVNKSLDLIDYQEDPNKEMAWVNGAFYLNLYQFKPLLRPLSDLTKEIEHNGEKFVPMDHLAKLTELNTKHYEIRYEYMHFTLFDKADEVYKINDNNFYLMEKLYEWHFDIHGLLDSGLAVDINTVKV